jgi:hypothetical protein
MLKKDKQKVFKDVWSDDHIKSYLERAPYGDENPDFYVLNIAYRYMVADDFARLVGFFKEAGRDVDAVGPEGKNMKQLLAEHPNGEDYLAVL